MLDIKNLERRWLKYKVRSYLPYISVLILSIILVIGIFSWIISSQNKNNSNVVTEKNITSVVLAKSSVQPVIEENTTVLEPSMDFVQSFQNAPILAESSNMRPTSVVNKPIQKHIVTEQTPKILAVPQYTPPSQEIPNVSNLSSKNQPISIKMDNSKLDINSLVQRFKETSNANLGLFIARYYYDHGNYDESYNYALKTNNANNRIDESWIIFSKSLVKLGKTDQAKKTLQVYISQSNSENAKSLLNSIENGSFK